MKKLIPFVLLASLFACGGGGFKLDQTNPESVVNAVFESARTGDFAMLKDLCDPIGDGDGDTRDICNAANMDDEFKAEFTKFFKDGKVAGSAVVEGDRASVPILFGPGASEKETFKLIQRNGKWYLYSI
ncbi:MAG: hypothetical protein KKA07_06430 [Bacteroidetes bacterium]|nr:hypothetical protein [Bacteroidota bacterium]MBU1718692.1 hypothetical protein [Bacteroidota bacterium]